MSKWRKKPIVVEAEQFMPDGHEIFMDYRILEDKQGYYLLVPTLEGTHRADVGDWIVTGVKGERYPVKPDIFEATYEQVKEGP